MSRNARLAYSDATWNPVRGCTRVSEGCRHCYAEEMAARYGGRGKPYEGLAMYTPSGPRWTGAVRFAPDQLLLPLHWRRPQKVFVGSMSDLFHEQVTDDTLHQIFAVMRAADWHTYQILTKRPERMRDYLDAHLDGRSELARRLWIGTSAEDQPSFDARWPPVAGAKAAVRFLSASPLLGPIALPTPGARTDAPGYLGCNLITAPKGRGGDRGPDWVIAAGETGPGSRPTDVSWIATLRDQCRLRAIPFFVVGLGTIFAREHRLAHNEGGDPSEWPEALRVREMPATTETAPHCRSLATRKRRRAQLAAGCPRLFGL